MKHSLAGVLLERLDKSADSLAYSFSNENGSVVRVNHAELLHRAVSIGQTLSQTAVRGDRVMLMLRPGIDYVTTFLGCCIFGLVSIPAYPLRKNQHALRTMNIISNASPVLIVLDSFEDSFFDFAEADRKMPRIVCLNDLQSSGVSTDLRDQITRHVVGSSANDLAFLQYTSGSTGQPKGTMVSYGNLLHNSEQMRLKFGTSEQAVMVSWLPPYHDMGLILGILHPLLVGFPCHLMAPAAFMQRPLNWLKLIEEARATISGGPNFAFDLCIRRAGQLGDERLDLSSWHVAFNGAETVRAETLRQFVETFEPHGFNRRSLYPCYGLAENTLMASGQEPMPAEAQSPECFVRREVKELPNVEIVHSGTSIDGQMLAIVDPHTCRRLPEGEIGEIWISGQSVAQGYWNNEAETSASFHAKLIGTESPSSFLRTGDLGQLVDGQLYIRGRIKELILVRGMKYYPQDIERIVEEAVPHIRPGGYCAVFQSDDVQSETVGVAVELRREHRKQDTNDLVRVIRSSVVREYGLRVSRVEFLQPGRFPKTSSGKIPRSLIQRQFIENALSDERIRPVFENA